MPLTMLGKQFQVELSAEIREEGMGAMIPALGDVMRYANHDDTSNSTHLQVVVANRWFSLKCGNAEAGTLH